MSGVTGVPKLRYFGTEANKNIIVMDLYSHNLHEEINNLKNNKSNNADIIVEKTEKTEIDESNSDSDLSNRNNTPESDSLNDKVNKYIVESTVHNLNPNYIEMNKQNKIVEDKEFSNDIDTTSEIFEENIVVSLDTNIQKNKNNIIVKEITKYFITILQIINKIHDIGIVHRDIKPENFMIGLSDTVDGGIEKKLYIIDFGISSFYIKNDKHIINNKSGVVGTPLFMSRHIHEENTYSRRDDIISILYVIIYLIKDTLPWDGYKLSAYDKKVITTSEELCAGMPHIFQKLLDYAYSLNFEEKPDYSYMIRQCKMLIKTL